jgi:hypothetical protein
MSSQLSPLLSNVRELSIRSGGFLAGEEDVDPTQWREFFQPFTHVTQVHISGKQLVPGIVQALLVMDDMATDVFPELISLYLSGYRNPPSVAKAAEQFVALCRLSGRRIHLSG